MALSTSRTSTERGRPPRLAGRISGAISAHSASVRSLGYRRPRRSAVARCSGFHMRHLASTQVPRTESQPTPETQLLPGWALRESRVIRHHAVQAQPAEPAIGELEVNLFAQ